jgi:sporulation protein YlmC with PRC-barrel domain
MRSLRVHEEVLGPDGHRLGTVDRLVVDERAHRVTHVVVGGRLVGVGHLTDADGGRLTADLDRDDLVHQPEARPDLTAAPDGHWRAPGGYSIGDFLAIVTALVGQEPYVPPVHLDVDFSSVHEIALGSPVFSDSEEVGEVSEVLTDDAGDVTTLVLRRPGVLGRRVRLPSDRVVEVVGRAVHLNLSEREVEALPDYEDPEYPPRGG